MDTIPQDSYMLADTLIAGGHYVEEMITPLLGSLERTVTDLVNIVAPGAMRKAEMTLLSMENPLTQRLPLMSPTFVLVLTLAYMTMVIAGPRLMAKRERFQLRTFSLIHNAILVLLSAYMCGEVVRQAWLAGYSLFNNPVTGGPEGWPMAKVLWVFYISKPMEFVDTLIMILKKNNRQVSFLHVYHHCTIFNIWWLVMLLAPNGETYFSAMLNSFIHVIMYGYYLGSALGYGRHLTIIKPFITIGQMTQFCLNFIQATFGLYYGYYWSTPRFSIYPWPIAVLLIVYMISLLALFGNFFIQDKKRRHQILQAEKLKSQ
ncbi:MAG: polyunsaturated fatty acid elongation enzyme [Piptocephalis tieghemiana]|nr:MAG: polyunsaturated fatty acid elongation enzyme [Piptocephalis tieghemiana]